MHSKLLSINTRYNTFGSTMPGRSFNSGEYRYGFQGQEKDDEVKGSGNSVNFKFRMYDPRIGRFFAVDPVAKEYPWYTPYQFSGNRVIDAIEFEGKEPILLGPAIGFQARLMSGTEKDIKKGISPKNAFIKNTLEQSLLIGAMIAAPALIIHIVRNPQILVETAIEEAAGIPNPKSLAPGDGVIKNTVPNRLSRVIDLEHSSSGLLDVKPRTFVTAAEDISGLNSANDVAKKLTLTNKDGSLRQGPFKIIEFDTPSQGIASPIDVSKEGYNSGFKGYGETKGGAREFTIPNSRVDDLKNVKTKEVE